MPAFAEHGITEKKDILAKIPQLFSKSTAAQLVSTFATQQPRIEKDVGLLEKAQGTEQAAATIMAKDLGTQLEGVKNAAGNVVSTLGTDIVGNTGALNAVSTALGKFNERLTMGTPEPGKYNRVMDAIFPGRAPIIVPGSAAALVKAKGVTEAARRTYAETSWRHPLDMRDARLALTNAMERELEAKQKFEASRPPVSLGMHAGQRHILGGAAEPAAPARLEGAATIKNSFAITLDPGLIAKEVRSQLSADGNLRADTGISMNPSSILPR